MRNYSTFYALLFVLFACETPKSSEAENSQELSYEFQKTDSLTVKDILARVFLYQGEQGGQYVFRDMASSQVYIFNKEGELENQWNKEGDVPGRFSMASSNFLLDKNGNLVIVDIMYGVKVLKIEGEVVQDFRIFQDQVGLGSAISLFDNEQLIEKNGKEYLLYSLDIIEDFDGKYDAEFLKERKNILMTDIQTNETKKLIPFPESSQFLNGNVFYFRDFRPIFHFDQKSNLLYLMFKGEPTLYIYNWGEETPELVETIDLELEGFETHPGFEEGAIELGKINSFEKRAYPSSIINLTQYGEDLLITYSPSPKDKEAIALVVAGDAPDETKKRLSEEAKMRTILRKPNGEMIPVNLPKMHQNGFMVEKGKIVWMKKPDPNVEAEEFTVYWGELQAN
ncbi:hypothetical protein [Algoriphagus machipongonensis]|uniref:Lipoprotein n=1 Tax=Algoriphagus machipongonensis TaxID=388413 RepID=A3HXQ2_9BACT|nr:hypothetical protein [Algoriphagus machipongonensis]EAZ81375.1 hypothetical protein ALPR1_20103 [Algoriphagus machipongonensis]